MTTYARRLGLFSGTMAVVGGIIGGGIFRTPAAVAERVRSPGLTLIAWVLGGVVALIGAFCFGELGTAPGLSVRLGAAARHRDGRHRGRSGDVR